MAELFDIEGHLTYEAFEALAKDENLDELSRLEIAEHLSFCDNCIIRYSEYLSDLELVEAPEMEHKIIYNIKKKINKILFNKYSSVAIAASFSIVLLISGVFTKPFEQRNKFNERVEVVNKATNSVNDFWGEITQKINNIDLRGELRENEEEK